MSTFVLKLIAMIAMFCDHFSYVYFGISETTILNYIGRFAIMIFCFQIVLGYKKTKSLKKYLFRLLLVAIISQTPYALFFQTLSSKKVLNVCFTLFFGLLSLSILNFHKTKEGKISIRDTDYKYNDLHSKKQIMLFVIKCLLIFIICTFLANLKSFCGYEIEYSYKAILFMISIYLFYPFENKNSLKIILYVLSVMVFSFVIAQLWFGIDNFSISKYILNNIEIYISIYVFCIMGGLIPLFYNGQRGKSIKWLTYVFYPVHLFILYFIYLIIK